MPLNPTLYLAQYRSQIQNTSTKEALENVRASFEDAYANGRITEVEYMALYELYAARQRQPVEQWELGESGMTASELADRESQTSPETAYQARLGIGGKQSYNPAESYQAGLFDPYKKLYDIQNRQAGIGFPGTPKAPGSFSEFLTTRGGGGMPGLVSGAQEQLKRIFGGTTAQKTGVYDPKAGEYGLGYEPGRGGETEAGFAAPKMDVGQIGELQQLLKYGLRGQTNQDAAAWAALRLPRAQQAYYGQKTGGELGFGPQNFVDWLKQNWGLQF